MFWALADLIVGRPYREAETWEKHGAFAENGLDNYSRSYLDTEIATSVDQQKGGA